MRFPKKSSGDPTNGRTAKEIADLVNGLVIGDASLILHGLSPVEQVTGDELTFADNSARVDAAEKSSAGAILVAPAPRTDSGRVLIQVDNPRLAVAIILQHFFPQPDYPGVIHPSAVIAPTARIDPSAHIGPHCVIADRVCVGAKSVLMGGNHVGRDCVLGEQVVLHPTVVIYAHSQLGNRVTIHAGSVIGSDGYGYVFDRDHHRKVPQVGRVVIEDDVEIGANTAIDRGALDQTVIGTGSKLDNLVHVAHNVTVGKHCLIMGQCGFAGSTQIGDYSVIASQSGVAGHLKLGTQVVVGAKSGVMRDIPDKETVLGIPARPAGQTKRQWIAQQQLPEMLKKIRELENRCPKP